MFLQNAAHSILFSSLRKAGECDLHSGFLADITRFAFSHRVAPPRVVRSIPSSQSSHLEPASPRESLRHVFAAKSCSKNAPSRSTIPPDNAPSRSPIALPKAASNNSIAHQPGPVGYERQERYRSRSWGLPTARDI